MENVDKEVEVLAELLLSLPVHKLDFAYLGDRRIIADLIIHAGYGKQKAPVNCIESETQSSCSENGTEAQGIQTLNIENLFNSINWVKANIAPFGYYVEHEELKQKLSKFSIPSPQDKNEVPSLDIIIKAWGTVGSTYHPILKINGKIYHFMNKEELAEKVIDLLTNASGEKGK